MLAYFDHSFGHILRWVLGLYVSAAKEYAVLMKKKTEKASSINIYHRKHILINQV